MRKLELLGAVTAVVITVVCIPTMLNSCIGKNETQLGSTASGTPATSGTATGLNQVYINPPVSRITPENVFSIDIESSPDVTSIRGAELKLEFAPKALDVLEVIPGETFGPEPVIGINHIDKNAGTLHYVVAQRGTDQLSSSSNTIATVRFKLKYFAESGPYDLILSEVSLVNAEFEMIWGFEVYYGSVEVK